MKKREFGHPCSVLLVAYNEAKTIERIVAEYYRDIVQYLPVGSEFLLYVDAPTDGTDVIAQRISKKYRLIVMVGKKNIGYAGAMKKGLLRTKNQLVFYSDSSGKHIAKDFWKLTPHIETFDIVTGMRANREDPKVRQVITTLSRLLVAGLFFLPFHDYNTGYKLLRRQVISRCAKQCRYTKQSFSTELLVRAAKMGFTIIDVPVTFKDRVVKGQGTNYLHLPSIIFNQTLGLFKLWLELAKK